MTVEQAELNSAKPIANACSETKSFADLSRQLHASLDGLVAENRPGSKELAVEARDKIASNAVTNNSSPEN